MAPALMFIGFFGSAFVWLLAIRPYAVKHKRGFTPGANMGVTAWVDWEMARAVAREKGDSGMLGVCRLFFWLNLSVVAGFVSLFIG